jgi:pyridoxal 5-phosphate dependent beta-lyase
MPTAIMIRSIGTRSSSAADSWLASYGSVVGVARADWTAWSQRRLPGRALHLDSAAAGRPSLATLEATAAHARLEAELGAYVAQAEREDVLKQLRLDVAGLFGVAAGGVAFVESATAALDALLASWPLRAGDRVGVVPAEWGTNLEHFARHGLEPVELATDGSGRIDVDALGRTLAQRPPELVHLTHVTSHRGLVQPAAAAAAVCRAAGIPLWIDAAQALAHVPTAVGADAVYGTSRKWLAGPRGVGVLAVAEHHWDRLDVLRSALEPADLPPPAHLESREAHVAGRVGLANAVREYLTDGPAAVGARLDEVGRLTREALGGITGWALVGDDSASGAITAIRPTAGQDVAATRARLIAEDRIVTTAAEPARAPREMREPLLRVSPHVDCTPEALDRLCAALSRH